MDKSQHMRCSEKAMSPFEWISALTGIPQLGVIVWGIAEMRKSNVGRTIQLDLMIQQSGAWNVCWSGRAEVCPGAQQQSWPSREGENPITLSWLERVSNFR